MSGNPHHFALPTPPSDHENDSSMFILFKEYIFVRFFYSFLNLFSAYYMSSLEGIRE
jgi:hypothetical protein